MTYIAEQLPKPMTKQKMEELYKNLNDETRKLIVEGNIRFAISIANSFKNTGIESEDLVMIAMVGLTRAGKYFKPELGYDFCTYAGQVIKGCIINETRKNKRHPYPKKSLNEMTYSDDGEVGEIGTLIPDKKCVEDGLFANELIRIINHNLNLLNKKHKEIVLMIINGIDRKDISRIMNCSQSNISTIFKRFKDKVMKECMKD